MPLIDHGPENRGAVLGFPTASFTARMILGIAGVLMAGGLLFLPHKPGAFPGLIAVSAIIGALSIALLVLAIYFRRTSSKRPTPPPSANVDRQITRKQGLWMVLIGAITVPVGILTLNFGVLGLTCVLVGPLCIIVGIIAAVENRRPDGSQARSDH